MEKRIYTRCNNIPQMQSQTTKHAMGLKLFRFLAAPWAPSQKKVSTFTCFGTKQYEFRSQGETADNCCCTCSIWCMAVFSGRLEFYVRLILDSWEPEWRHATQWHWSQRQNRGDAQGSEWSRWRWEINQWGKEKKLRKAAEGGDSRRQPRLPN